jgi:AraC-like DNA-binding protein
MGHNSSMQNLALLLTGFSIIYSLVFVLTHFVHEYYLEQKVARIFGLLLMLCLAVLQIYHFNFLNNYSANVITPLYLGVLLLIAPSFYFYARPVLKAQDDFKAIHLLHFTPLLLIFILKPQQVFTLAFVIGSLYLLWLLKTIYALRTHKGQFKNEILLLTMVFIIAIGVSIIALTMPFSPKIFYSLYASAIGLALFIVALVVSYQPGLSEEVSEVAKQTYAVSTLTAVDCEAKLALLTELMDDDQLYQQSNLDRQTIASELDLSTHQLSELINTKLGMGFSQYLRTQRINAAKELLLSQPKASVLSIGLEVGFSSQSNFYEAFKELVGTTPAKFRKS